MCVACIGALVVGGSSVLSRSAQQLGGWNRTRQRGATALEFAFVFPLLFLLMYGILVYAYIFLLTESLTFVAQEAAESAVAVDPVNNENYESQVQQRAHKRLRPC